MKQHYWEHKGLYVLEEAEEELEDEESLLAVDTEFNGLPRDQLLQAHNWVHHAPHISEQGRCYKLRQEPEEDEQDQEEPEEDEEEGPKLLTPISEDEPIGALEAWSLRSVQSFSRTPPVFAISNRWPGAYAAAYANKFINIYIGFATKKALQPYFPPLPPPPQAEYSALTFIEEDDPTLEQEQELEQKKQALAAAAAAAKENKNKKDNANTSGDEEELGDADADADDDEQDEDNT